MHYWRSAIPCWFLLTCVSSCGTEAARTGVVGAGGTSTSMSGGSGGSGGAASVSGVGGAVSGQPGGSPASMSGGAPSSQGGGALGVGGQTMAQAGSGGNVQTPNVPKKVLIYTYPPTGEVPNLAEQVSILSAQLQAWGFSVETSQDPAMFTDVNLGRFGGVALINTCGELFGVGNPGTAEAAALQKFVQAGGGLFATHCASVTLTGAPASDPAPYNKLLGGRGGDGYFGGESTCTKLTDHPTNAALPATFSYTGDTDNTDYLAPDTVVVVRCKWSGNGEKEVAASWYRTEGLGRIFFTTFAKTDADLKDAMLRDQHLFPALSWVLYRSPIQQ